MVQLQLHWWDSAERSQTKLAATVPPKPVLTLMALQEQLQLCLWD